MRVLRAPGFLFLVSSSLIGQRVITTTAGTEWLFSDDGAAATSAAIGRVTFIDSDAQGNILLSYVDNSMVMRVAADGIVKVVAGNGLQTFSGIGDQARNAALR